MASLNGAAAPANGKRLLRVLVVDDDRDTTDSMALLITLWGHDVRPVYDATAVLETTAVFRPDVLLLDIGMPGVNGFRLARRLRRRDLLGAAILIAVTGYADDAHRSAGARAGFDLYWTKPVAPDAMNVFLRRQHARLLRSPAGGAHATIARALGRAAELTEPDAVLQRELARKQYAPWRVASVN